MKTNGLLKWLLIPVLLLAVWVAVKLSSHRETPTPPQGATTNPLTPAEMADLGIPADTPHDTVATLVAQVEHLQSELQTSDHQSQAQKAENDALRRQLAHVDAQLKAALQNEDDHGRRESEEAATDAAAQAQTRSRIDDLEQKVDALTGKGSDADLPIGLGLRPGDERAIRRPVRLRRAPRSAGSILSLPRRARKPLHHNRTHPQTHFSSRADSMPGIRTIAGRARTSAVKSETGSSGKGRLALASARLHAACELNTHGLGRDDGAHRANSGRWDGE